jgi:hypothetical protein
LDVRNVSIVEDLNIMRNSFLRGTLGVDLNASFATTLQACNVSIVEDLVVARNTNLVGGLRVNGVTTFDSEVILNNLLRVNNVSVSQGLSVSGTTTLLGKVDIKGSTDISNTLYVTGHSRHGSLECNNNAEIKGNLTILQSTTMTDVTGTNASFNNLIVKQNASFDNNLFVRSNAYVQGNTFVDGDVTVGKKCKVTTLVYDTLESTNTSTVNQVVNQLTIQNFYSANSSSRGYFDIAVPTRIIKDLSSNIINGITFETDTKLVMENNTTLDINGNLTVKSGANATFDAGSNVFFNASTTTFKDIILNGRIITTSDRKLKTNIHPLTNTLQHIRDIHGHSYQRVDQDTERVQIGLIAQEVETSYPELVTEEEGTKRVDYISFIAVLLECIKELESRVILLEGKS